MSKGSPLEGKVGPFANFLLGSELCRILDIQVPESEQLLFKLSGFSTIPQPYHWQGRLLRKCLSEL